MKIATAASLLLSATALVTGCGGETRTVTESSTETVTVTATAPTSAPAPTTPADKPKTTSVRVGAEQRYENVDLIELDGKPVRVRLRVRVSKLDVNAEPPQYLSPQKGTKYVRVEIRIRNLGPDSYTPSAEFQAVTEEGDSNSFQSLGQPGDLGPAAIRQGRSARGRIWAEIPKGSTLQDIVFAPFGGDPETDLVWSR